MSVISEQKKKITVSVGELAELTRTGDINKGDPDFIFGGHSSALEGMRGHQLVQASRGDEYQAEKTLSLDVEYDDYVISVHGRADGVSLSADPVLLEEIKTLRMPVAGVRTDARNLHWQQLRMYGHLLVQETGIKSVILRLCYYDLDTGEQTLLDETATAGELAVFFQDTLNLYFEAIERAEMWMQTRNRTIRDMKLPYDGFRAGQRDISVAVYKSTSAGDRLVLQAPTGIGKTMATLFPTIKALGEDRFDHIFYVSAKTSGQLAAESAITRLQNNGLSLRQVTLTAKEKTCFTPGAPCHPDHCSFAKGYYDRVRPALAQVLASDIDLGRERIESRAREFHLCPFEFSLDLAYEADVIIGDYNYVFDPTVYLRRLSETSTRCALLVDESHNLVDRGREMFSAVLTKPDFLALRKSYGHTASGLSKRLESVNRQILALRKNHEKTFERDGFLRLDEIPRSLIRSLQRFCETAEVVLRDDVAIQEDLLSVYFDVLRFLRTAERFNDTYAFLLRRQGKDIQLQLYNIDPASQLQLGFDRMTSAVCFSATMRPQRYYRSLLGIGEDASWYGLPSPFARDHLGVFIATHVRTSFHQRRGSAVDLVALIRDVVAQKQGNYLVFFPSYAYLEMIVELMGESDFSLVTQTKSMTDEQRQKFLELFAAQHDRSLVGLAVMGGVFAEGIDLKGEALIGTVVVGVGLPQLGIERNLIRDHFGSLGFEFAYQHPGMNRVLQTAGRVIRDEHDRGIVVLVDPRFTETSYHQLLPAEWQIEVTTDRSKLACGVSGFWARVA